MKKIYFCITATLFLTILSCNEDEIKESTIDVEEVETIDVAYATSVSKSISINSTKAISGTIPESKGFLEFSLKSKEQFAFQKYGFNIKLNIPNNYAGTYMQIKGTSEYFNVPANNEENSMVIDINFDDVLIAGKFCYLTYIYDTDGSISEPVEACIQVEDWGGNTDVIGNWNIVKYREVLGEDRSSVYILNEKKCNEEEEEEIDCVDGTIITIKYSECDIITSHDMIISADGTYSYKFMEEFTYINYNLTEENCALFLEKDNVKYFSKGKWSYNESINTITFIEFDYEEEFEYEIDVDDNRVKTKFYPYGNINKRLEGGLLTVLSKNSFSLFYVDKNNFDSNGEKKLERK